MTYEEIARELERSSANATRMMIAAQLRGFEFKWYRRRHWLTLVRLLGSLLIRSDQQAQRVHQAMILRGYGQSSDRYQGTVKPTRRDYWKGGLMWGLSLGLIGLNFAIQ